MQWNSITSSNDLAAILEASKGRPQVVFKHSTTCPISSMARMRLEDNWDLEHVDAHYLDLLQYRPLSNAIAEEWQVHHESPQVLLIIEGEVVYDASHLDITVTELKESLSYAQQKRG